MTTTITVTGSTIEVTDGLGAEEFHDVSTYGLALLLLNGSDDYDLHREFARRDAPEYALRYLMVEHPRLVFQHGSATKELRQEMVADEAIAERLHASPYNSNSKRAASCLSCILVSTEGKVAPRL